MEMETKVFNRVIYSRKLPSTTFRESPDRVALRIPCVSGIEGLCFSLLSELVYVWVGLFGAFVWTLHLEEWVFSFVPTLMCLRMVGDRFEVLLCTESW